MQVREFTSAAEMKAFYATLKGRPAAPVVLRRRPVQKPAPVVAPAGALPLPSVFYSLLSCRDGVHTAPTLLRMADLLAATSRVTGVHVRDITARFRKRDTVAARQVFCWLARRHLAKSYPEIGKILNRDHSTVHHAVEKIEGNKASYAAVIKAIEVEAGL